MSECAIVGGGLAGLVAYTTLRHGGLQPEEIVVFGSYADPAAAWRTRAAAIRQRAMRSESDGHCGATSFPGLAIPAARRRRSLAPIVQSWFDRFHPTVDEFLDHVGNVRRTSGWDESLRLGRVERIRPVAGGFELDDHGAFAHVLVAPGHPGLNVPEELAGDPRAVHAYEPHEYASELCVIGAGMAAATEWMNALSAGARVVSVRRREPQRRSLNVPRKYFTKRGLGGFHRLPSDERIRVLNALLQPSYPPGGAWDEPLRRASKEGRFSVEQRVNGAEQVICATGFVQGFAENPLLRRLVEETGVETASGWVVLTPDSCISGLTDGRRTLGLAGAPAQWAFPAADTLVGMKYAARRFLAKVRACRTH
jgi:cation diffusion facilitator CzcD-associated flavoprotein CzcO